MLLLTVFSKHFFYMSRKVSLHAYTLVHTTQTAINIGRYFQSCCTTLKDKSNIIKLLGKASTSSPPWRILFFGTDEFSLESLKMLWKEMQYGSLISRLDVVTSMKFKSSPVGQFAVKQQLTVHDWPMQLTEGEFDIGLVASFGHLIPQHIIKAFPLGMLNVHASLLPRWRGAAPIIYAILNGDIETGVTIMQIKPHKFDIGGILCQARYSISPQATMPEVSAGLAKLGAERLMKCVQDLPECLANVHSQPEEGVTHAPRVTSALAVVSWQDMDADKVYNMSRAVTGLFPLATTWHGMPIKLYTASIVLYWNIENTHPPGHIVYHKISRHLRVKCGDGHWVAFKMVGIAGKKPMTSVDFYNGYLSKKTEDERFFK